jgi:hypothetical protein
VGNTGPRSTDVGRCLCFLSLCKANQPFFFELKASKLVLLSASIYPPFGSRNFDINGTENGDSGLPVSGPRFLEGYKVLPWGNAMPGGAGAGQIHKSKISIIKGVCWRPSHMQVTGLMLGHLRSGRRHVT